MIPLEVSSMKNRLTAAVGNAQKFGETTLDCSLAGELHKITL